MEISVERKLGIPKIPVDKKVWTQAAEQPGNSAGLTWEAVKWLTRVSGDTQTDRDKEELER